MNVSERDVDGVCIVECLEPIVRHDQAVELVTACFERRSRRLLLDADSLTEVFFDLRTRLAGEVLQKLQNYQIRVAGVFPEDGQFDERFSEFLIEARRGSEFRAFATRAEAEAWLVSA